jgi:hypothetical protein
VLGIRNRTAFFAAPSKTYKIAKGLSESRMVLIASWGGYRAQGDQVGVGKPKIMREKGRWVGLRAKALKLLNEK